jgi:hypothetical protein
MVVVQQGHLACFAGLPDHRNRLENRREAICAGTPLILEIGDGDIFAPYLDILVKSPFKIESKISILTSQTPPRADLVQVPADFVSGKP